MYKYTLTRLDVQPALEDNYTFQWSTYYSLDKSVPAPIYYTILNPRPKIYYQIPMVTSPISAESILQMALTLASNCTWEQLTFQKLATCMGISLVTLKKYYRSKDDLAEALFECADTAMLNTTAHDEYPDWDTNEKLFHCIINWLEFLTPYKDIVKDILLYKLEPGHFHLQAHGITRISRTVQWFREVAQRPQQGFKVTLDEVAITSLYLISFAFFLRDNSYGSLATRKLLRSMINKLPNAN